MILNSSLWPYIVSIRSDNSSNAEINWHSSSSYLLFTIRDYNDTDYWYIDILHGFAFFHFPIETLVPAEILERIRRKDAVLIVSNFSEAYHSVVADLYDTLVIPGNIPAEQVLLFSNSPDIATEIEFVSNKHGLPPIRAEWLISFEWDATIQSRRLSSKVASDTLSKTNYAKKFLCFNGQPRPHRMLLVSLLCAFDILNLGHVSYKCFIHNYNYDGVSSGKQDYLNTMYRFGHNPDIKAILGICAEPIKQLAPMFLDTTPETQRCMGGINDTHKQYYEDTYFSVITETLCVTGPESHSGFTGTGRILSEKTFKPIINKHPFILLGVPKSLQLLRDLGYKTFSPWIDESYDDEMDDAKRIFMVALEVKKLATLPDDKLAEFLIFAREIVNHNYTTLLLKPSPRSIPLPISGPLPQQDKPRFASQIFSTSSPGYIKPVQPIESATLTENSAYVVQNLNRGELNLPTAIISHLVKDSTSSVVIVHDWSPCYIQGHAKLVRKMVSTYKIKPEQVYLILMDPMQVVELRAVLPTTDFPIHIAGRNRLLINETLEYNEPPAKVEKMFSIFSRSSREWRFHFYCDLIKEGLLDQCIYSYMNTNSDDEGRLVTFDTLKQSIPPRLENMRDRLSTWVEGMPYSIVDNYHSYFAKPLSDAINKTNFHIVLETYIDDIVYVTEKTWKPISVKKPFLIYGAPGSLAWLQERGYKTFSPWIDEKYDKLTDPNRRKQAIINEMKRITALPEEDLARLLIQCSTVTEHNYQLFLSERDYQWPEDFASLCIFN